MARPTSACLLAGLIALVVAGCDRTGAHGDDPSSPATLRDHDGDGFSPDGFGDCDDANASVFPAAEEVPYDGIDQDCSGADLTDVDHDGHRALAAGGDDCDDQLPDSYPGRQERCGDGVDQDCDGVDPVCPSPEDDYDRDGHTSVEAGGDDCDDTRQDVSPSIPEIPYDGVDQDCDASDLVDPSFELAAEGWSPSVTAREGGFVVAWVTEREVRWLLTDERGRPAGAPGSIPARAAWTAVAVTTGSIWIAWAEPEGTSLRFRAARLRLDGTRHGPPILITTFEYLRGGVFAAGGGDDPLFCYGERQGAADRELLTCTSYDEGLDLLRPTVVYGSWDSTFVGAVAGPRWRGERCYEVVISQTTAAGQPRRTSVEPYSCMQPAWPLALEERGCSPGGVAPGPDGEIELAVAVSPDGGPSELGMVTFSSDGSLHGPTRVVTTPAAAGSPLVAGLGGGFLFLWSDWRYRRSVLFGELLDSSGRPRPGSFGSGAPFLAPDGRFHWNVSLASSGDRALLVFGYSADSLLDYADGSVRAVLVEPAP